MSHVQVETVWNKYAYWSRLSPDADASAKKKIKFISFAAYNLRDRKKKVIVVIYPDSGARLTSKFVQIGSRVGQRIWRKQRWNLSHTSAELWRRNIEISLIWQPELMYGYSHEQTWDEWLPASIRQQIIPARLVNLRDLQHH